LLGSKRHRATGIHVTESEMRLVEMGRSGQRLILRGIEAKKLARPLQVDSLDSADGRQSLVHALGEARRVGGLGNGRVMVAVDHSAFLFKRRPWVRAEGRLGRDQLEWEVKQFLPSPPSSYRLDFVYGEHHAFVAAVPCRLVDSLAEIVAQAGMRRPSFDLLPLTLFNLLEAVGENANEGGDCILAPAAGGIWLVLVAAGQLLEANYLPWEEEGDRDTKVDIAVAAVNQMVGAEMESDEEVRLWLAGTFGPSWSDALEGRLSHSCHTLDPFRYIDCTACEEDFAPLIKRGSEFAVAAGLACRGLTGD
jgi:Tfp pilus assembly PilM family ATPase